MIVFLPKRLFKKLLSSFDFTIAFIYKILFSKANRGVITLPPDSVHSAIPHC
nr:MAG TPA: hypothetical protein [Caudoviricetes sp.]